MEEFMKLLGEAGYSGEPTVEAIQAWLSANPNVSVTSGWQELFKAAEPPAAPTKSIDASGIIAKAATARAEKAEAEAAELRRKAAFASTPRATPAATVVDWKHKAARDGYKHKIKAGVARFSDVDEAEVFAAAVRLMAKSSGGVVRDYPQRANDLAIIGKTYSTNVMANGGVLVAPEIVSQVLYMTEAYGAARLLAREESMGSDTKMIPRKTGIGAMAARAEGGAVASTQGNYDMIELVAKGASARLSWTREVFQDSAVSIADEISKDVAEAYSIRIDEDFFNGDGTSTYNNHVGLRSLVTNTGGRLTTVNAAGGWGAVTVSNLIDLIATPVNVNSANLMFAMSRQAFFQIGLRLALSTAKAQTDRVIAEETPGRAGADAVLMGYPVKYVQVMPTATANAQRCIYFGDFKGCAAIGIREDLDIMQSEHTSAANGLVDVFAHARYAVNIHGHGRSNSSTGMIAALLTTA